MRTNWRTFADAELKPASLLAPLELESVFRRIAPIEVDLGCGDGSFLTALAEAHPERDFVGVEQMPGRVRAACRKIGNRQLSNARVLQMEVSRAVNLLPRDSVDVFYLMFPDPWPKRRHLRRRVVTPEFLRSIERVLRTNGTFQIKTDQADYLGAVERLVREVPQFGVSSETDAPPLPATTFEERFLASGAEIHRLVLRKLSVAK